MDLLIPPATNTEIDTRDYNLPLYGIKGQFSISEGVVVPYFISLLTLQRVTKELKTHDEVNPSLDTVYNVMELFQRTIDYDRVKSEIVNGYLRVPNKLKFFNSLTVALLPKDQDGQACHAFEDYENNDPKIPYIENDFDSFFNNADWDKAVFGGVQFVSTKSADLARLRWDSQRVDAVAVDGQHRLRALKIWMEGKNYQLAPIEKPTRVPIIFLLLHSSAGFKIDDNNLSAGIKSIAREIFTDLNKNAREVDLATQIILDDRSIEACCVRSLITDTTCTDDDKLLPLSLLRWQETNNRFDQKYFLNSLVNLHLLVKSLIDIDPPKDPMNKNEVNKFIKKIQERLGSGKPRNLSSHFENQTIDIKTFYENNFLEEDEAKAPFTAIPPLFIPSAVKNFNTNFSSWLLRLLKEFKPYKDILIYARNNELITGIFAHFLSQPKKHQEHLEIELQATYGDNWRENILNKHIKKIENIKGLHDAKLGEQWAFKTIFQKAFVRLGRKLFFDVPQDRETSSIDIDRFIKFMDTLYTHDILRVHAKIETEQHELWTFISVNYGNRKIKVTQTSETNILYVLTLWYYGWKYIEKEQWAFTEENIKKAYGCFSKSSNQRIWPSAHDYCKNLKKIFLKNAHIISSQDEDALTEEAKERIAQERLIAVIITGLSVFCQSATSDEHVQI